MALKVIDENILADTKVAIGLRVVSSGGKYESRANSLGTKYRPKTIAECAAQNSL